MFNSLRASLSDVTPPSPEEFATYAPSRLWSLHMRQPTNTKRRRPARFTREELFRVDLHSGRCLGVKHLSGSGVSSDSLCQFQTSCATSLSPRPLDSSRLFFTEDTPHKASVTRVRPQELTEENMDELMQAVDQVTNVLTQFERRWQRRQVYRRSFIKTVRRMAR